MSFVLIYPFATSTQAVAEDRYWTGGTGAWENPANWSPAGAPPSGYVTTVWTDTVYLTNAPGSSATATYTGATYPDNTVGLWSLQIYGTETDTMTLSVSSGKLVGEFHIWNNGIINQSGGTYSTTRIGMPGGGGNGYVWSGGTYNLSGGTLTSIGDNLVIQGVMNQTGGEWAGLDSAVTVFPGGVYNLSGTGVMNHNSFFSVRGGTFNQEGATANSGHGGGLFQAATYNLSGGSLTLSRLEVWAASTFNQSGGTVTVSRHNENSAIDVGIEYDGTYSGGTYNLSGGRLEASRVIVGDRFNYSGGELVLGHQGEGGSWAPGTFTNGGTTTMSGLGTRTMDGHVVNTGTFKTTQTTAAYTGTFINNGAYISDTSTHFFGDLIVNEAGYVVGQDFDEFHLSGDFRNHSEMSLYWNTMRAYLGFSDGDDSLHSLDIAGEDFGATMSGYINNFSWATLDILDDELYLFDGNDEVGAGLYVGGLLGAELSGDTVANVFGSPGLTIYYQPDQSGNDYLAGLDYKLSGGGYLRAVPEPSTLSLLGAGLFGLCRIRQKDA